MRIEDIDRDMNEVKASTASAQKAFQEEDYVTAAKVYSACVAKLRKIYSDDHPDTIKCFLLAGDSFFYLEKFSEAADTYLQLESIADSYPHATLDRSVLYFKTAKALEKAKRFDAAQTAYSKAISVCEKTLSENHPLLTIVNESFAGFLRHVKKDPSAANPYEKRAEALRERNKNIFGLYENYLEPLKRKPTEPIHSADLHQKVGVKAKPKEPRDIDLVGGDTRKIADPMRHEYTILFAKIAGICAVIATVLWSINFIAQRGMQSLSQDYLSMKPAGSFKVDSSNLLTNGGFDEYDHQNRADPWFNKWVRLKGPVLIMDSRGPANPSDGYRYVSLGGTGQIVHPVSLNEGKRYVLMFDTTAETLDNDPVLMYSVDNINWRKANALAANVWNTETYEFVATPQTTRISFCSGSTNGTKERYLDKVRLYRKGN